MEVTGTTPPPPGIPITLSFRLFWSPCSSPVVLQVKLTSANNSLGPFNSDLYFNVQVVLVELIILQLLLGFPPLPSSSTSDAEVSSEFTLWFVDIFSAEFRLHLIANPQ